MTLSSTGANTPEPATIVISSRIALSLANLPKLPTNRPLTPSIGEERAAVGSGVVLCEQ